MISHLTRKCIVAIYTLMIVPVDLQMAMYPMFPPPMQVPVPMPVPVPILIRGQDTTHSTTTTTEASNAIAFPIGIPVPMQMPFAFPAFPGTSCQSKQRPKSCPPCPPCLCLPSCTPAFFSYCSPCHQKCRCRSNEDTPTPIPPIPPAPPMGPPYGLAMPVPPMMMPPPVVVIPFPPPHPPRIPRPNLSSSSCENSKSEKETDCSDDTSFSISSYEKKRRRRKKYGIKRRYGHRRMMDSFDFSDNELVKPVLTYISRNGDIKLKKRLSNDEAAELMNDKSYQNIRLTAGDDEKYKPRVLITSMNEKKPGKVSENHRRKQVMLSPGMVQHMLTDGQKELVFRPPGGKKISNLSVSFQISD